MSAVRYVLARAAEQGFVEAVVPEAERFDPLLRGGIRRAARRAFQSASAATRLTDEPHVLRLAFVRSCGWNGPPDDVAAVQQAYDAAKTGYPKRRGRAFWPVSFATVVLLLVAGGVAALVLWFPSKRDRFAHSSLGESLGEGLTDYTVGVGNANFDREEKGRNEVLTRGTRRQIGDRGFDLLGTALDQCKALHQAPPEEAERARTALDATLSSLAGELQTKKVPAFVDAYVERGSSLFPDAPTVWLLGYYVEDRATLTIASSTVPILRGHRLDNLNLQVGSTAYESKVLGGWVVALDDVEQWVVEDVVPALGKSHGFGFGEQAAATEGSAGRLASKVGDKLRSELLTRAGLTEDEGTELADLLSQRHSAFLRLSLLGDELFEPRGLRAKPRLKQALSRRKDLEMDAREISRIEDKLSHFEKPFDKLVTVQAGIEELRAAVTANCEKATCKASDEALGNLNGARLAAHLLTVARSDATYTALAEAEIGPAGYAAYFLIERELGLAPEWLAPFGVKDEAEHGQLGVAMFDKPADAIRKAAESAYAKAFGSPMPTVSRTQAW